METFTMSGKERKRLEVLSRVKRGEVTLVKAAEVLELSYRQTRRVYQRYCQVGDRGLVHRLRGRPSNRRSDKRRRERLIRRYREKYGDFGPTLAAEYLSRDEGQAVAVSTLRRWLKGAGLWQVRQRHAKHRRWRPRKDHVGEMVQMDGSHHDWFEGHRGRAVLMVMIDDATNRTYAQFFEEETTSAAMTTFEGYVEQYGLPRSLYVDRDSIYETTREATTEESLRDTGPLTQFGRAMRELEVKLILARSPQAKGRVERRHGVLQDRLVKALRVNGIRDLAKANRFLRETFLSELNRRFTVEAQRSADLHRRVPRGVKLKEVLSFQESRVVQNDWTIAWRHRWFQLTESNQKLALARRRVLVCEQLDGTIHLRYRGRELPWIELPDRPRQAKRQPPLPPRSRTAPTPHKPAADHPWRRGMRSPPRTAAAASPGRLAPSSHCAESPQAGRGWRKAKLNT